jgi:hypothetical protein
MSRIPMRVVPVWTNNLLLSQLLDYYENSRFPLNEPPELSGTVGPSIPSGYREWRFIITEYNW